MTLPPALDGVEAWVRAIVREEVQAQMAVFQPQSNDWLTVREAADYLRVSQRTLERLIAAGELRSTNVERRRLVRREWLDAFAEAREERATSPGSRRRGRVHYSVATTHEGGDDAG
jgi:excisionase family DNA binding protein